MVPSFFRTNSGRTKFAFAIAVLLFVGVFIYNGKLSPVQSTSCGANCSLKEIGTIDGLGNFSTTPTLIKDQPYWVRLTINGQDNLVATPGPTATPAPKGVDTMMYIDLSSSMLENYPKYNPDNGTDVIMYQAAQTALNKYIDSSDQANDYLGFGTFTWCINYKNSATPVWWSYDDFNRGDGKMVGFSAVHIPLRPMANNPNYYKNIINSITFNGDDADFCAGTGLSHEPTSNGGPYNTTGEFHGGTSIGGAITGANTFLTPILNDPKAKRKDGTSYRDSVKSKNLSTYNRNMGPYARQYTTGAAIPKYIILATDGGEGVPPLVTDEDIDHNTRTIVQNAKQHGVKIFMVITRRQSSLSANGIARINYITGTTGGKAYYGNSEQELVANFSNIRTDIVEDSNGGAIPSGTPVAKTDITVTEKVNASYFKIDEPTHSTPITFKVGQPGSPETDITNLMCKDSNSDTVPDCVSNKKYNASGNLIGYDVTLDPIGFGQTRYIYFRVTPTKSTGGLSVPVDEDPTSVIDYEDIPATVNLDNVSVVITEASLFFQVFGGGDVYSASNDVTKSIYSFLPGSTDLFSSVANVVFHRGGATYGNGKVNSKNREVDPYAITYDPVQMSYNTLYNEYSKLMPASNIKNISGLSDFTTSGYYMDNTSTSNGKFEIKGAGWTGQNLQGKKIVMFVPGNLYISTNFSVEDDGNSLLVFIVKGDVGIDPDVTNVQGVYIVDGKIDTACKSSSSFNAANSCSPDAGANGTEKQLTLEGMYITNSIDPLTKGYNGLAGGFLLDRKPTTAIPGERFIYRPDFIMSTSLSIGRKSYTWIENTQ